MTPDGTSAYLEVLDRAVSTIKSRGVRVEREGLKLRVSSQDDSCSFEMPVKVEGRRPVPAVATLIHRIEDAITRRFGMYVHLHLSRGLSGSFKGSWTWEGFDVSGKTGYSAGEGGFIVKLTASLEGLTGSRRAVFETWPLPENLRTLQKNLLRDVGELHEFRGFLKSQAIPFEIKADRLLIAGEDITVEDSRFLISGTTFPGGSREAAAEVGKFLGWRDSRLSPIMDDGPACEVTGIELG
jgi:hypothetical protein